MWSDIGYYEDARAEVLRIAGVEVATEAEAEEMILLRGYHGFKILPVGQKVDYIGIDAEDGSEIE